jgi:hypothetical protein
VEGENGGQRRPTTGAAFPQRDDPKEAVQIDGAEQGEVEVEERFIQVAIGQPREQGEGRDRVSGAGEPILG